MRPKHFSLFTVLFPLYAASSGMVPFFMKSQQEINKIRRKVCVIFQFSSTCTNRSTEMINIFFTKLEKRDYGEDLILTCVLLSGGPYLLVVVPTSLKSFQSYCVQKCQSLDDRLDIRTYTRIYSPILVLHLHC